MAEKRIRNSTISNLIWRFLERTGAQSVTFVVSVILARILEPEVYGTVALVTVFTSIMQVFVDSGMGNALIQKKDADDLDFSSVFFFNISMCTFLYLIMFFAAPIIAAFYGVQELTAIIRVLSLTLIISGVKNIQQAYISRNLMFKKFFFATLGGTVGAAVVGVVMAYLGFGVWALVAQSLFNAAVDTIILWITVKWRPKIMFSVGRVKLLFSYGWKLLASSLLDTIYNDLRSLIIGKVYSAADLAFYGKGKQFPNLIVTNINTSIDSVLLPVMSQEQDDASRIKAMTRRAIRISTYIMAPVMVGLAVCSETIIELLLTEKWLGCVFFLRIFCITYMFYPIHTANLNAIKAMGRSDMFLRLEIVKKIVGLILMFATIFISVKALAYSLLISTFLSTIINSFPNKKLLDYSWFEQIKDIMPNMGLSICMGFLVYLVGLLPLPSIVVLGVQIVAGGIIYVGISIILKYENFNYLWGIIRDLLKKRNRK